MRMTRCAWRSLKTKLTLFSLAIFLLALWSLSFYASQALREDLERLSSEQQFASVSLLATHINDELAERLNALHSVAAILSPQMHGDSAQLQSILQGLPVLQSIFNGGFFITDLNGIAGASVPLALGRAEVSYADRDYIAQTLASGTATVGQPIMGRKLGVPALGMAVPITDPQGKLIGALAGIINLGQANFLERITASHYGKSGGYSVIARQARRVITSTDKDQVMLALPPVGSNPMIDRAVAGEEGSGLYTNIRGVKSLGSVKGIPLANWYLLATLPITEAFAPIHAMQQRLLLATLALSLLAALLVRWMLSRQLAPMLSAAQALSNRSQARQQLLPLPVTSNDEIGALIRGFNHLLATLEQREEALKDSQFRWQFAIEGSGDGVWDWQIQSGQVNYSNRWKRMFGYEEQDSLPNRQEWLSRIHPHDQLASATALQAHLDGNSPVYIAQLRLRCQDGSYKWVSSRGMLVSRSADGQPLRMIGTHTDISAAKHNEAKLQLAASVFTHAHEGIMITTADGCIIDVNAAVSRITGYGHDQLIGQNPRIFNSGRHNQEFYRRLFSDLQEQGYWAGEIWNRRQNGEVFASLQTISAIRDEQGEISQYTTLFSDVTERKTMEEQVHQLAFFDALTQLPNRRLLDDRLNQAMLASTRSARYGALMFLDLDNFKPLNDTHGHVVGDLLLVEAAQRLKTCVREIDTVARFGGDEFVVVVCDLTFDLASSTAQATAVANKIRSALAAPYQLRGEHQPIIEHHCSVSIGVALFIDQHTSQAELMIRADAAMYAAKAAGRDQVRFYAQPNIDTPVEPDWHSQHFTPNS